MAPCVSLCAKSLQSCPSLQSCSPAGSSVHGILQAQILESAAMPSSRGSSWPRDPTCVVMLLPLQHPPPAELGPSVAFGKHTMGLGANTGMELALLCWCCCVKAWGTCFQKANPGWLVLPFFVVVVFFKPHQTAYEILVPHQELALSSEYAES